MQGPEVAIELFHGYTYSGHPVAAAAGLATLDVYQDEGIFEQAAALEKPFEDLLHSFVITSYSIHYTKLYDHSSCLLHLWLQPVCQLRAD